MFYSGAPTVFLEDREETDLTDGLLSMMVEETTVGLYRCELTFGNWRNLDYLYFDRQLLDFGKSVSVNAGDGETDAILFEGRIMALEGRYLQNSAPQITILAEDRLQDLRMTRRTRDFEDVTDSEVIEQIASQYGLQTDIDVDGPTHPVLAQLNQSDLAFLRERMRAIDAELWVEGGVLHAQARNRRQTNTIRMAYLEGLMEFTALADLANQCTSMAVSGWDVAAKEEILHEADESAIRSELNGGQGGGGILQEAIGQRPEQIVHLAPATSQEARYLAEGHYRRRARRFVTAAGLCQGDGRIRVGVNVQLERLGPLFDEEYYITEVRHTFDRKAGFLTRFVGERPWIGSE